MTDYAPYQGGAFQPPPGFSGPARPVHVQAWIAMVALGLSGAEALVAAGLQAFTYPVLAGLDEPTGAQSAAHDYLSEQEPAVAGLLLLCAGLAFVVWLYRARTNLESPDAGELAWGRGWTIGGWFIPLGNVAIPQLVVSEIDRVSERRADQAEGRPHRRHRGVVVLWVVLWSITVAVNQVGELVLEELDPGPAALLTVAFGVLTAVAAGSAILLVRQVTTNQERVRQVVLRLGWRAAPVAPGLGSPASSLGAPGPDSPSSFPGSGSAAG